MRSVAGDPSASSSHKRLSSGPKTGSRRVSSTFRGRAIGAVGHAVGEVVFNTSMTGYQEILTDPSYSGQIVTLTYPHVGNVGVNRDPSPGLHEPERDW